jgi:hypothetical protein
MASDLLGGIKNAMERKESIEKIRLSFLNAGYKLEEVNAAINESNPPYSESANQPITETEKFKPLPTSTQIQEKKSTSKSFWIILIIICVLILSGAALLGLYWNKIAGLFG